ncbi:hypothetical protein C8J57DRAFT_1235604 [Mycena rebaudengoi]|nr:hypothetical protein C8J57DRAFT_1235604 [Mycena rebaudengoi]
MVPPPLQDLMLIFLMVVTVSPLEIYFVGELEGERRQTGTVTCFASLGSRWSLAPSPRESPKNTWARRLGSPKAGRSIPVSYKPFTSIGQIPRRITNTESRQGTHAKLEDGKLLGLVTSDEVKAALKFSERYHRFWGLDSKTGPVHKTAANLEEFSTPVGTISRWHYGSNDDMIPYRRVYRSSRHLWFQCSCGESYAKESEIRENMDFVVHSTASAHPDFLSSCPPWGLANPNR